MGAEADRRVPAASSRHDGSMTVAPPLSGMIVCLDDSPLDDLVGPIEVLVQEGLRTLTLPAGHADFGELTQIFGARARFGAHGVATPAHAQDATEAGAGFLLLDSADAFLVASAAATGAAVYPQAMTPAEIRAALGMDVAGVTLYPADVVGHVMAKRLAPLGLVDHLVPRGGVGAFAASEWLKAGAPAVCVDDVLLADALRGGDLGNLRDRCPAFVKAGRR